MLTIDQIASLVSGACVHTKVMPCLTPKGTVQRLLHTSDLVLICHDEEDETITLAEIRRRVKELNADADA